MEKYILMYTEDGKDVYVNSYNNFDEVKGYVSNMVDYQFKAVISLTEPKTAVIARWNTGKMDILSPVMKKQYSL